MFHAAHFMKNKINPIVILSLFFLSLHAFGADQNLRQHGAKGDGVTHDSAALQSAIDAASAGGGGVVRVPPGKYLIADVQLKSNITLRIEKGATLLGSTDLADYSKDPSVLNGSRLRNVTIEGEGTIDGQCMEDMSMKNYYYKGRYRLISLRRSSNITLRGLHLLNSDRGSVGMSRCQDILVEDITLRNNLKRISADGMDFHSCKNLKITRCDIISGDDAICFKTWEGEPFENVVVTDCVIKSDTAGIKIGTGTEGDFRNFHYKNIKITAHRSGVSFFMYDGGDVENILVEDVEINELESNWFIPLYVNVTKRHDDSKVGAARNMTFRNIQITSKFGSVFQRRPEGVLENITLENITFTVPKTQSYKNRQTLFGGKRTTRDDYEKKYARAETYSVFAGVKNLTVDGLEVNISDKAFQAFPRSAMSLISVEGAAISNVSRSPKSGAPPVIEQSDCVEVELR
jgi:polygalacturonase